MKGFDLFWGLEGRLPLLVLTRGFNFGDRRVRLVRSGRGVLGELGLVC